ncbi:hypothetical protein [Alkaliphilus serpentinus]|uniref:GNAT family N-acetyltransferase n=1 Tax=Alkaliphilus serpentinus TaxID=1482731 RepID=A0A833HNF4_9FIRM|nr:hypothetical protein [Alkaliphilus serpentinus]KAB3529413.1 hypothetical protein F8153_09270 [Alkaliphilus serpentinus]
MTDIFDITSEQVEVIRELWEKNRQYHEDHSEYFSEIYRSISFDDRMKGFRAFNEDALKITVAEDDGELMGYCIL